MKHPLVTVLMPAYNAEDYLPAAIESVLGQSFKDFEFLIINDGSTDKSQSIIEKYAKQDKRIKLTNQANKGLVASLNAGLNKARGEYIARQDADDVSEKSRLAKQARFMQAHPKAVLVGSSVSVMDEKGKIIHRHAVLLSDPELRQELLIRSPFAHGSVMFRRGAAIKAGLYDEAYWPAEDYELWLRLSDYGELANLDEYLYVYREHGQGISDKNRRLQQSTLKKIQQKAWLEHRRLLAHDKINLEVYRTSDMGELRIERMIANAVFAAKQAWRHNQKSLSFKIMSGLAGEKIFYKKTAGKVKRKASR